jgi:hypothetical protein
MYDYYLPREIISRILLYSGNLVLSDQLKQDLKNFVDMFGIYRSLTRTGSKHVFAQLTPLDRARMIYHCPENTCISYVQEYPSFRIYEWKNLVKYSSITFPCISFKR